MPGKYSLNDLTGQIRSFLHFLARKSLFLFLFVLAGVSLGLFYYWIQKPKYEAVCTFILEDKSAGGGGLAGLASQFGFNLGGLTGGGSIFAGDNILDILKSKRVVEEVLLNKVDDKDSSSQTLVDYYLGFTGLKKSWSKKPGLANLNFASAKGNMSVIQDSVLNVIYESLVKNSLVTQRTSKQGSIIKVQVTSTDNLFSRLLSERIVNEAARLYMDIRVGTARENLRQMQRRSDSLLILLNNKSFSAAASQPLDMNPGIRTAIVPTEIATRDKTVLATLYAEVTKNLEAGKLLLSQQTPVIQVLDRPSYLLDDRKKGVMFLIVISAIGAAMMFVAAAFLFFLFFDTETAKKREKAFSRSRKSSLPVPEK